MVMPYMLDKGPYVIALEQFINELPDAELGAALVQLRAGADLLGMGGVDPADPDGIVERLRTNWFGRSLDGGAWTPQAPFHPESNPTTTGYWKGYHGDVEAILRETFVRAVEVALGIDHDADPTTSTRRWPVEVFWTCPRPWFEGWVTWRTHATGGGQVTVVLASPGERPGFITTDLTRVPTGPNQHDPQLVDPASSDAERGMWVISHEKHSPVPVTRPGIPADADVAAVKEAVAGQLAALWNVDEDTTEGWVLPVFSTSVWVGSHPAGGVDQPWVPEPVVVVAPAVEHGGLHQP